jgi:catechol 2,3-dioxygenase-like lactoylglutathione lyase family enzyme
MKNDFLISGIQQIGIGVENFHEAWKFYIDVFNMNIRILEDDTVAEMMLPYTGNSPQKRHACIAINMQGGGGFELWQYSERKPLYPDFEINLGDYGIFAAKIKSRNIKKTYEEFHQKPGLKILTKLTETIDGNLTFFVQDPWNNVFQICYDSYIFHDENRSTGGVIGAIIGVSDIEKAQKVYCDILGYDKIIADQSGIFNDLIGLASGNKAFRRVLLSHSAPRKGAFSQLFGPSYIELVQILETDRPPRKIYENRYWGDPGFIQICFDVANMNNLKKYCKEKSFPFTVDSAEKDISKSFDMGEAAGRFAYIEDPDGTLIELVETHKIPLLKSLKIYLNLKKRNPEKALPKWMLKFLKYGKVKL